MLQEQSVCGLKHEHLQQHLVSEGDTLTLDKTTDIAQAMDSAIKH